MEERGQLLPAHRPTSAMWSVGAYVLLLELVDALTYYGISQGFKNFMQAKLGYSQVGASSLRSTWTSFCDIVPLASAYVADEHLGRFRAILLAGAWYVGGVCLLVIASHPVMLAEYNGVANVCFLMAIFLGIGLGNGGFDSNVVALGADQFTGDEDAQQRFFSYFYLSMNIGSTVSYGYLAYLCVHGLAPIVPPEAGYFATFAFCGVALVLALGAFLKQSHRLIHTPPTPGALTRTAALFAAPALAPIVWGLGCFWLSFVLNFAAVFVDNAAMASTLTCAAAGCIVMGMSLWLRNATDKKVLASACLQLDPALAMDLNQVLTILPFGVFQIVWNAVYDQLDANFQSVTQQCDLRWDPNSGRHGAQVPGAMLGVFDTLGVALWIPLLDHIVHMTPYQNGLGHP
ncbi:hypothetical protein SDRG_06063 [Saprolegnia diclina VS20]|uniref:Uncharacterized protein n=1 Tax=Saprolegnia diclina (strain VS20) TaxID=1156394 RepID=T0RVW5_SAPDV|nr:hypothetical protein SDRG_06063 [Saprolegnia diclina VS20]EQC36623.1 hypothetical protein SDRG_06063 [Saprolegnia diclina VS20]|eukprot:XP_008610044.1 hypothetical protein SDRG_06063 [Saprolegnia diclina VS20]